MLMDLILEISKAVLLAVITIYLWLFSRKKEFGKYPGWRLILLGFFLLFFASVLDVTDEVPGLERFVVIGQTEVEGVLEKVVGFTGGFFALTIGLIRWLPVSLRWKLEEERAKKALLEARDTAETANQMKSAFLANMSHEIRTPMNAITGYLNLVLTDDKLMTDEHRQMLGVVRESTRDLLRIIDDILDISKFESGEVTFEDKPFHTAHWIGGIKDMLLPMASAKGLDLTFDVSSDTPQYLSGDSGRLKQILVNLIGNAIKFTETGSVKLETRLGSRPDELLFSILDTGIGIPADKLASIFHPFCQSDETITRRFGGSGLGITISQEIIKRMGGTLSVESTVGNGSCFKFNVFIESATQLNPTQRIQRTEENVAERKSLRILVAEDVKINILLLEKIALRMGHTITAASNGLEALTKWRADDFDVILMDVHMPEMDGMEAARLIRQDEQGTGKHIPIIALTASVMVDENTQYLASGMDAIIHKPIDLDKFRGTLDDVTGR
ncbi:hypothetical protein BVX99_03355 [bacterium F16]|nr:hypothetical protein BVX99_03355 [bacterium F16]